jgi:hypothetical protein
MGAHLLFMERASLSSSETGTRLEFFQGSFSIPITPKRTITSTRAFNTFTKAHLNTFTKDHLNTTTTPKASTNTSTKDHLNTFTKDHLNTTTTPKASTNTTPKALVRRGYSRRGASLFPKL